jgi:hypothetical protein
MVHTPRIEEPTIFIPTLEQWKAPSDEEIKRRREFSVVLYAPKYDEKLREEATITYNETDGTFEVEITKVGKAKWSENLGRFSSYEEAKAKLYSRFDDLFNTPSPSGMGGSWDYDKDGNQRTSSHPAMQTKRSISLIEGDEAEAVLKARVESVEFTPKGKKMKSYTIRVPDTGMPTMISVRTLYPSYFKHIDQLHTKRVARLRRIRQSKK